VQEENNEKRSRRSTRHYVVNDLRAEILATHFGGVFSQWIYGRPSSSSP
jgi:hypothetical protein